MRLLFIDQNDLQLFNSSVDNVLYNFFLDHLDTFRQMWEEQGKKFWVRFLIAFHDYVYNKGQGQSFIRDAELNYSINDLAVVGDGVFLNIHRHFIEGKLNNARDFMEDMVCLARNGHLLLNLGKKSIVNNPLYVKEVRDSFRKLFLYPQLCTLSNQNLTVFQIGFATPIYMKFCGAVTVLLKRWLTSKNCQEDLLPIYWPRPFVWNSADYNLSPFHVYLLHMWSAKLDEIAGVQGLSKTLTERMNAIKAKSKKTENPVNVKKNDTEEYSIDGKLYSDEIKERKLFLLAQKQFDEESHVQCTAKHKKRKKKKNAIKNAFKKVGNPDGKDDKTSKIVPDNTEGIKVVSKDMNESTTSTKECISKMRFKMNDLESEIREIKENIDMIKNTVQEEGGLDYESFVLMLKTGELLTRKSQPKDGENLGASKKVSLHNCSHCGKNEVTPKTFKKCSRCKVENVDNPRYYCCRDCQIEDWEECHRKEHSLFQKK